MKSIAFNDSHDVDEFVIVDTPMDFDSSVLGEEDEESYDHCDDAFSFSSLNQTLPVSSMEAVRDNFFEPPAVRDNFFEAVASSPSLLSDDDDNDDDEEPPAYAPENSSTMQVVFPRIDSDVEGLCALVSSISSVPPSGGIVSPRVENSTEVSDESVPCVTASVEANTEEERDIQDSSDLTTASVEDKEEEAGSTTPSSSSSSSGPGTSTDEGEYDDIGSSGPEKALDALKKPPMDRVSKKKRRKQLKLAKKAAAAAAAAAALSLPLPPKRRGKNRKKVANIAVCCAVQSIVEYKEQVERTKVSKKIH